MEPFKRLNWGQPEEITAKKLNDMIGNDNWLYENNIQGAYDVLGVKRETGLTIRTGYVKGIASEDTAFWVSHYFPKPFLPGVRPVVVCSIVSATQMQLMVAVRGLDDRAIPDHRGFKMYWAQFRDPGSSTKFVGEQYASYVAIAPNG